MLLNALTTGRPSCRSTQRLSVRPVLDPVDAAVALPRVVVAGVDDDHVVGTPANRSAGRLGMFFSGMVTMTTSPARAASSTVTALAPVSAARAASVSGPRELATETSCPSAAAGG